MKNLEERIYKSPKRVIVVWFSCGAASAVAAKKTIEKYGSTHRVIIANTYIKEEHPDNRRFLKDVQKWIGQEIINVVNSKWPESSIIQIFDDRKYMGGQKGAPCTMILKKEARREYQKDKPIAWNVFGFTSEEIKRHEDFVKFETPFVIPLLIDEGLTNQDCFDILNSASIKVPVVYDLGFPNANCLGCVKATSPTYWNHLRKTFPDVFDKRARQSRRIGAKLVRVEGTRIYLDELKANVIGNKMRNISCNGFCNDNEAENS